MAAAFSVLGRHLSWLLDRFHVRIYRHTELDMDDRFRNFDLHWNISRHLDNLRDTVFVLNRRKYVNSPALTKDATMVLLKQLQEVTGVIFGLFLTMEKNLLMTDLAERCPSFEASRMRQGMAWEHHALVSTLYQFASVKLIFFSSVQEEHLSDILLGAYLPSLEDTEAEIPHAAPMQPTGSPSTDALQFIPAAETTCLICWGEHGPNYTDSKFIEYLESKTTEIRRPFPEAEPETELASAGCCSAFFHHSCLFEVCKKGPHCPQCQQVMNTTFHAEVINRKSDEFAAKTRKMVEILRIEHKEFLESLQPVASPAEAPANGVEMAEE